jgi:hypothetical protein
MWESLCSRIPNCKAGTSRSRIWKKSLKIWLLTLGVTLSGLVSAQTGAISGLIKGQDGDEVSGATIHLLETDQWGVSDTSGYYMIDEVRTGRYTIIFTHLNYQTDSSNIVVKKGETVQLNRQLLDEVSALDEIEIIGKTELQEVREKPFEVNVIDVQPLQQKNIDLNRILTQSSGVRVRQNAGL